MGLTTVTPAYTYPVALDEIKLHCRIDATDDDAYLNGLIIAGTEFVQQATGRQLITATYDYTVDAIPDDGVIALPLPPLQSITSVKYYDGNNAQQTLSNTKYRAVTATDPGAVVITTIPTTYEREDAVTVRLVAGYGDVEDVPEVAKVVIKLLVGEWYLRREATISGTIIAELPIGVDRILSLLELRGIR
jgi:uncharacterized phiE125 gp8 family phage protein